MAVKKPRERSGFVIYSYFIDSAFAAVKGMKVLNLVCERSIYHLSNKYIKGVPFLSEMAYRRIRDWILGQTLPL